MAESPEGTGINLLHITPSYWPATIYGGPTLSEQAPALVREDFEAGKVAGEYLKRI